MEPRIYESQLCLEPISGVSYEVISTTPERHGQLIRDKLTIAYCKTKAMADRIAAAMNAYEE